MSYKIDIIIPVYKNMEMTGRCLASLFDNINEIFEYDPRVIIVNDSPDDKETSDYLDAYASKNNNIILLKNKENRGFVYSVNAGLELSRSEGRATILVNSDTITFEGTLINLVNAANKDPQIGFACPRSNNASLSTFPLAPHLRSGLSVSPKMAYDNWNLLKDYLPEITFSPVSIGFYLFISRDVVLTFGTLSDEFGMGYEEENDLIMRANMVGFRAILANHSFAYHVGSASFSVNEQHCDENKTINLSKMVKKHEYFIPLVQRFESSPEFRTEKLIKNLIPSLDGVYSMAINCQELGLYHNGTSDLVYQIIKELSESHSNRFMITVICEKNKFEFHGFDKLKNIYQSSVISGDYALSVNLSQPFNMHAINSIEVLAPINIYGILDVIAYDCGYLSIKDDLYNMWSHISTTSNGLFYISEFSSNTFKNRFSCEGGVAEYVALLPTNKESYVQSLSTPYSQSHILVVGNHFRHKYTSETVDIISKSFTGAQIVTIGGEDYTTGNVRSYKSGLLTLQEIDAIYANSSVIVLPSFYEGFGFSLMKAIALGKPIVVRNIPAVREILQKFKSFSGIFLFDSDGELVRCIEDAVNLGKSEVCDFGTDGWKEWVNGFSDFCLAAIKKDDIYDRCVRRIRFADLLRGSFMSRSSSSISHANDTLVSDNQQPSHENKSNNILVGVDTRLCDNATSIKSMISIQHNECFLYCAYKNIFNRLPDESGWVTYLRHLSSGASREKIISDMVNSSEAKEVASTFPGINKYRKSSIFSRIKGAI